MTQRELASEFQVTSGAIAHWEAGKRPIPGPVSRLVVHADHARTRPGFDPGGARGESSYGTL
jgi:hypothetical protein